jgi:hypothetical protein
LLRGLIEIKIVNESAATAFGLSSSVRGSFELAVGGASLRPCDKAKAEMAIPEATSKVTARIKTSFLEINFVIVITFPFAA